MALKEESINEGKEVKFTAKDLSKYRKKIWGKITFTLLFFIISLMSIICFYRLAADNYVVLTLLILIFFGTGSHLVYLTIKFKDDLKTQIKILKDLKIIGKRINTDIDGFSNYFIFLEGDVVHQKYEVFRNDYDEILINTILQMEYTKYGKWILKIEYKGKSIENAKNFK